MKNIFSSNKTLAFAKKTLTDPVVISVILIIVFLSLFELTFRSPSLEVKNGSLELGDWNFERDGLLALNGNWEFHWNRLLSPVDFKNGTEPSGPFIRVPGYWTSGYRTSASSKTGKIGGISGNGYSTYRLLVHSQEKIPDLAIKVDAIFSAYKLWIGDKQVLSCGLVGDSKAGTKAGMESLIGFYQFPEGGGNDISITIQAANFIGGNGGIIRSIYIGTPKQIQNFRERKLMKENFQTAITLYMGLFFILLFVIGRKEAYSLYLGFLCIMVALRGLFLGELAIYTVFSGHDPQIFYKISFVILCLSLLAFVMYFYRVFPYELDPLLIRVILLCGMAFNIPAIIFPYSVLYKLVFAFEIFALLTFIVLAAAAVRVVKKRLTGYAVMVAGSLIVFLSSVNDVLSDFHIFNGWLTITNGIFIFLILLTLLLAKRFAATLHIQELFYRAEIASLQAQIKPHFIFNVINTISYYTGKDDTRAHSLLQDLANYLRSSFSFKNSEELVDLSEEISNLTSYLHLEEARFGGRLKIIFDIPPGLSARIPPFLLQPIVENALKHGILPKEEGGSVRISASIESRCLIIKIEDDGVGMSHERLDGLFDEALSGYGVGVRNVNKRLKHQFGRTLRAESLEGKGTVFTLEIPQ